MPTENYLHLVEQHQEASNWCWAATTVSIVLHYDSQSTLTQCSLANTVLNLQNCCLDPQPLECNQTANADDALEEVGCLAPPVAAGAPTFQRVMKEIDAGHPISFHIDWKGGSGGHNPVVAGYDNTDPANPTIDVEDPLWGPTTQQDFNNFYATYHGGASWNETYYTKSK